MQYAQWMSMWDQAETRDDWTRYLQQTEHWLKQGTDLWQQLRSLAQFYSTTEPWIQASQQYADGWETALKDWMGWVCPQSGVQLKDLVSELEQQRDAAEEKLKDQKQDLAKQKRAMAQKEKAFNEQTSTLEQLRKDLTDRDRNISDLQKRLEKQAARILALEAQSSATPSQKAPGEADRPKKES